MIWDEIQPEMQNLARNAQFILGPSVQSFKSAFAKYCGVKHCIGLNNGTTSLHMALLALGVGPGDEVITTPHSWDQKTISGFDAVLIATAHQNVNYEELGQWAKLIIDTRNAMKSVSSHGLVVKA
jgi:hypothetical protein